MATKIINEVSNSNSAPKRRKMLLLIIVSFSFVSASVFLLMNILHLTTDPNNSMFSSIPFLNESYKQLLLLLPLNHYVNIIASLLTFVALLLMIRGKKSGFYFYIFTRLLLVINTTLIGHALRNSLSSFTQLAILLIFSLIMIMIYSYLIKIGNKTIPAFKVDDTEETNYN